MLNQFDFERETSLVYDPHGVIVARRSTYKHESRGMIKKETKLEFWEEYREIFKKVPPISMTLSSQASSVKVFKALKCPFLDPQLETRINEHHRNNLK
jgi:hypothetical protein